MRNWIYFLLLSLMSFSLSAEEEPMTQFDLANQYYEQGQFDSAIAGYQSLLAADYYSSDLHYNLANAYYKTNQIAPAILHYEKALKIEPGNEDAAYNLKLAQEKTIDRIESIPELFIYRWSKSIFNLFGVDQWAKLVYLFLIISIIGISAYLFLENLTFRKLGFYLALSCFGLGLLSWLMASRQNHYLSKVQYAIVMEPTVNINSSPSTGSSKLFVLHEGTKLKVEEEKDAWYKVSLPNGNKGWIKKAMIAEI